MAAIDTSRTALGSAPVANRMGSVFTSLVSVMAAWNDSRLTRNSLNALTDRELDDIGLSRGDIEVVANRRF